jgi:5-hydroxyisourate hydrolase-like protein (transthyretin family)
MPSRTSNRSRRATLQACLMGLALAAGAGAQTAEIEPNQPCASAQRLTAAGGSFSVNGQRTANDVDFYRVTGTPGALALVHLEGAGAGVGTLLDGYLGAFESDCTSLLASDDQSGPGSDARLLVQFPPDGVLILAATSWPDSGFQGSGSYLGTYRLRASADEVTDELTGRLLDAETGEPVSSTEVVLRRCENGTCDFGSNYSYSDSAGRFRFQSDLYFPLTPGEYRVTVHHYLYEPAVLQFEIDGSSIVHLGDLLLTPIPTAGSIRGRLIDEVTRRPLPGDAPPYAYVRLQFCPENSSFCSYMGEQYTGSDGTFEFVGTQFDPLRPGRYQIVSEGDQYFRLPSDFFTVAEDEHKDIGDLLARSFPVRLQLLQGCDSIPSGGGRCRFTVRVTNGQLTALWARGWPVISGSGLGTTAYSSVFQLPQKSITLLPGSSTSLAFAFDVPGAVPGGAFVCASFFAAPEDRPLQPLSSQDLFCLRKSYTGFERVPEAELRRPTLQGPAGQTEPGAPAARPQAPRPPRLPRP